MANETFALDYKQIGDLASRISAQGSEVESVINDYLHNEAAGKIKPAIEGLVPVSGRPKIHARDNAPFGRQENFNLAVKLITSKKFNYLVFPDEGLGTSKVNAPQDFTGRGLETAIPELIDEMTARVIKTLN